MRRKKKGNTSLVYIIKNKKRELIVYNPFKTHFSKLLSGTYDTSSKLLTTRNTKLKGEWLLPLKLIVSKGVQAGPWPEYMAKAMARTWWAKVSSRRLQEVALPFR